MLNIFKNLLFFSLFFKVMMKYSINNTNTSNFQFDWGISRATGLSVLRLSSAGFPCKTKLID